MDTHSPAIKKKIFIFLSVDDKKKIIKKLINNIFLLYYKIVSNTIYKMTKQKL